MFRIILKYFQGQRKLIPSEKFLVLIPIHRTIKNLQVYSISMRSNAFTVTKLLEVRNGEPLATSTSTGHRSTVTALNVSMFMLFKVVGRIEQVKRDREKERKREGGGG